MHWRSLLLLAVLHTNPLFSNSLVVPSLSPRSPQQTFTNPDAQFTSVSFPSSSPSQTFFPPSTTNSLFQTFASSPNSIQIITTAGPGSSTKNISHPHTASFGSNSSFHPHPHPFPTVPSVFPPFPTHPSPQHTRQSTAEIILESFGGLAGLIVLLGLARCLYAYRKAPERDRVAAVVDRHLLERELAALQAATAAARRQQAYEHGRPAGPPPPPYVRAPEYEEVTRQTIANAVSIGVHADGAAPLSDSVAGVQAAAVLPSHESGTPRSAITALTVDVGVQANTETETDGRPL